jgi:hypothetical protein
MDRIEFYKKIVELIVNFGYDAYLYDDYSGRGMYGRTVPAIVTSISPVLMGAYAMLAASDLLSYDGIDEIFDEIVDILPKSQDNMGLSMIYY